MGKREITKKVPPGAALPRAYIEKDRNGYEMVQELSRRSGGVIKINISTLYLVLKRLMDGNYISSYNLNTQDTTERYKVYYKKEDSAEEFYEEPYEQYQEIAVGVQQFLSFEKEGEED